MVQASLKRLTLGFLHGVFSAESSKYPSRCGLAYVTNPKWKSRIAGIEIKISSML